MPFDFPQTARARVEGYIDTMRAADGDPAYPGYGRIVIREDDGTYRHCAIGIVVRDYFNIEPARMLETWASGDALIAHEQIVDDLRVVGLPMNFISSRHDWRQMPLTQIADELAEALGA